MRRFTGSDSYVHLGYESVTLSSNTASILGLESTDKSVQMSGRKGFYVDADLILGNLHEKYSNLSASKYKCAKIV